MDNFQAIGQLVIKAQDLLDSIKGGAIRVMQTQFDALKQTIASEWGGIKNKMNNDVSTAIGRVDDFENSFHQVGNFKHESKIAPFFTIRENIPSSTPPIGIIEIWGRFIFCWSRLWRCQHTVY